jgi:hypothetical protein
MRSTSFQICVPDIDNITADWLGRI